MPSPRTEHLPMTSQIPLVILDNGVQMPILGFGVYQITPEQTEQAVTDALAAGYRHIDTAAAYVNEEAVGRAIKASGIPREELFVTTKLWVQDVGQDAMKRAVETSLATSASTTSTCTRSTSPSATTTAPGGPCRTSTARGCSRRSECPTSTPTGWST